MSTEGTAPVNPATHQDADCTPELEPLHLADKPDGPGAAMMVSAGFAIFVLGFLTVLAEASAGAKTWLQTWQWGVGVGPLAGKTTIASLLYFASLALLWAIWRNKDVNLKNAFSVGLALGILGALGTFPTFFTMFTV
jgi:fluoride ion exporter CrcB/FEX